MGDERRQIVAAAIPPDHHHPAALDARRNPPKRFPNVITPACLGDGRDGFHRSLNHSFQLMGYPPFSGKWFAMFDHYIYGNQNAVEIYGRRMPFSIRNLDELEAQSRVCAMTTHGSRTCRWNGRETSTITC